MSLEKKGMLKINSLIDGSCRLGSVPSVKEATVELAKNFSNLPFHLLGHDASPSPLGAAVWLTSTPFSTHKKDRLECSGNISEKIFNPPSEKKSRSIPWIQLNNSSYILIVQMFSGELSVSAPESEEEIELQIFDGCWKPAFVKKRESVSIKLGQVLVFTNWNGEKKVLHVGEKSELKDIPSSPPSLWARVMRGDGRIFFRPADFKNSASPEIFWRKDEGGWQVVSAPKEFEDGDFFFSSGRLFCIQGDKVLYPFEVLPASEGVKEQVRKLKSLFQNQENVFIPPTNNYNLEGGLYFGLHTNKGDLRPLPVLLYVDDSRGKTIGLLEGENRKEDSSRAVHLVRQVLMQAGDIPLLQKLEIAHQLLREKNRMTEQDERVGASFVSIAPIQGDPESFTASIVTLGELRTCVFRPQSGGRWAIVHPASGLLSSTHPFDAASFLMGDKRRPFFVRSSAIDLNLQKGDLVVILAGNAKHQTPLSVLRDGNESADRIDALEESLRKIGNGFSAVMIHKVGEKEAAVPKRDVSSQQAQTEDVGTLKMATITLNIPVREALVVGRGRDFQIPDMDANVSGKFKIGNGMWFLVDVVGLRNERGAKISGVMMINNDSKIGIPVTLPDGSQEIVYMGVTLPE